MAEMEDLFVPARTCLSIGRVQDGCQILISWVSLALGFAIPWKVSGMFFEEAKRDLAAQEETIRTWDFGDRRESFLAALGRQMLRQRLNLLRYFVVRHWRIWKHVPVFLTSRSQPVAGMGPPIVDRGDPVGPQVRPGDSLEAFTVSDEDRLYDIREPALEFNSTNLQHSLVEKIGRRWQLQAGRELRLPPFQGELYLNSIAYPDLDEFAWETFKHLDGPTYTTIIQDTQDYKNLRVVSWVHMKDFGNFCSSIPVGNKSIASESIYAQRDALLDLLESRGVYAGPDVDREILKQLRRIDVLFQDPGSIPKVPVTRPHPEIMHLLRDESTYIPAVP